VHFGFVLFGRGIVVHLVFPRHFRIVIFCDFLFLVLDRHLSICHRINWMHKLSRWHLLGVGWSDFTGVLLKLLGWLLLLDCGKCVFKLRRWHLPTKHCFNGMHQLLHGHLPSIDGIECLS